MVSRSLPTSTRWSRSSMSGNCTFPSPSHLLCGCLVALALIQNGSAYSMEKSISFHPMISQSSNSENASSSLSTHRSVMFDGTDVLRISELAIRVHVHHSPKNTGLPHSLDARTRKFSIVTNNTAALLYIGGYDHGRVKGEMVMVPMSSYGYSVKVDGVRVGDDRRSLELFEFVDPSKRDFVSGDVDFSQPCLCFPNHDVNGTLRESPYERFSRFKLESGQKSISLSLKDAAGQTRLLRIPGDVCVQPCSGSLVLGDPFYRNFVVLYDLSDGLQPRFGFGKMKGADGSETSFKPQSPDFFPHLASTHDPIAVPVEKKLVRVPSEAGQSSAFRYLYLIHASLGTPAKIVTLALDTKRMDLHMFDSEIETFLTASKEDKSSRSSDFSNLHIETQLHKEEQKPISIRRTSIENRLETLGNDIKSSFHLHNERTTKKLLLKKTLQKLRRSSDATGKFGEGRRPRSYEDVEVEDEQVGSGQVEGMLGMRKVARVPAMVGINAVLIAAIFTITVRLWSKPRRLDGGSKSLRAEQGDLGDAYGSLSSNA